MSRKIKFRLWNPTYQEMLYPSSPTKNGDYEEKIYLQLDGVLIGDFKHTGLVNCSENYVIQQFTGLKDKNGKDIYEGDLVKAKNGIVYTCKYSEEECSFILDFIDSFVYLSDFDGLEVIGNIFEK